MNLALVVCPGCRTMTPERIDVRTLERRGDLLACACGRHYPIIDGVPVVLADLASHMRRDLLTLFERPLPAEVSALLADNVAYGQTIDHLSTYLDAHWGDLASPPTTPGSPALLEKINARALSPVELAVELGCSAGRGVAALATGAAHVVGVELHPSTLRRAHMLLAGETVAFARKHAGVHVKPATITAPALSAGHTTLVLGDALDPPLVPRMFDRVAAFNLLDSVSQPRQLLAVLDGLCAAGGEVMLTTPYHWQASITPPVDHLQPADVHRHFTDLGYSVEDEDELPWSLRQAERATVTYRTHYLRVRKP